MKLGVIVPYRKRPGHLRKFRQSIKSYLKDQDYELIVVMIYHLIVVSC